MNNRYGYYVRESDMMSIAKQFPILKTKRTTDIFLNFVTDSKKNQVQKFINLAKKYKIRVHIWMLAFFDGKNFVNPLKNGKENSEFMKKRIERAKYFASLKGVAGIHFDYLRYPGNAYKNNGGVNAINSFVKQAVTELKKINKELLISAAIMPETTENTKYYGQDLSFLSQHFDVIVPMIYKGNYKQNKDWIEKTTDYFVKNSKKAKIWVALQSYYSDSNVKKLPSKDILDDSIAVKSGKGHGVMLFRYGLSDFVNFNTRIFTNKKPGRRNPYPAPPRPGRCIYPGCRKPGKPRKPVIYLYPEKEMDISVEINMKNGYFTTIYPKFNEGNKWNVHAKPNGDLIIKDKTYPYLFWEAESYSFQNMNKGFVVKSDDAEKFLEEKLRFLGLNDKESTDFITYWLPLLLRNKLSLCSFQTQEFFDNFEMNVNPKPDSMLRVFLSIKKLDYPINVQEQKLERFERKGFSVIEWGGSNIDEEMKEVAY